ncbi:two-component response regulator [Escherichia coli]|uniref:Two-component response regulator n=1 Tax=Escherichia coli TaxID=562 RepID=A0A376MW99_ECOLX|nr:two-component response regulator [Escherichia coli]
MQNQPVDLILLDINLPDENGLMLTRALRERSTVGIFWLPDAAIGLTVLLAGNGRRRLRHQTVELRELVVRVKNLLWRIDLARQATAHSGQLLSLCGLLPECVAPYAGARWRAN